MDYSLITEQAINNRYNTVPDELREAVDSEQTRKIITDISKTQYLDENKSLVLEQLVALVLLGFMSTSELVHELREELFLNHEHARVLANELNNRIFESLKEELVAAYNPPAATMRAETTEKASAESETAEAPMPITSFTIAAQEAPAAAPAPIRPIAVDIQEGAPAVLQKQTPFFERTELKSTGKKPALSFNTFASSSENAEAPRVQAKIETPLGVPWTAKKEAPKEMKKVVHYGEFSQSTGAGRSGPVSEFINLEALKRVSLDTKPAAAAAQPAPITPIPQSINPDVPTLIMPVVPKAPTPVIPATTPKPIVPEEKKSPLMWGIGPLSVGASIPPAPSAPSIPSAPIVPVVSSATAAEPKRMDAIVSNSVPPSAPRGPIATTPAAANNAAQPALDGNIIHLR